ncbi:hypothetical protein LPJ74_002789 [Coemansia sp. RSA 1843]|nr:hypothetical protein LPJ74_002789 [Coemansia sp. RSA 1843]
MHIVALGNSGNSIYNTANDIMSSRIVSPSGSESFSSISLDDDSGYAQNPKQQEQQNNRGSWGLGIVLANPDQEPLIENTGMGMAGLMTTQSPGYVEKPQKTPAGVSSLPTSRTPTKSSSTRAKQSMSTTDVPTASFFHRLATGITSFMSTTPESGNNLADKPKSQIEDMLVSYYLSQGREVPDWVHNPPPDPPVNVCTRPTSIVLTNPPVPAELGDMCDPSQIAIGMEPSREGSSQPGSSKSVLQSFARLNISRFTRNPFNKGLQSPSMASGMTQAATDDLSQVDQPTKSRDRSRTPRTKQSDKYQRRSERPRRGDSVFSPSPVTVQIVESTSGGSQSANDSGLEMLSSGQTPSVAVAARTSAKGSSAKSRNTDRFDSPRPMSPFSPRRYFPTERVISRSSKASATPTTGTPACISTPSKKQTPTSANSPKTRGRKKEKTPRDSSKLTPKHRRNAENKPEEDKGDAAKQFQSNKMSKETNLFEKASIVIPDNTQFQSPNPEEQTEPSTQSKTSPFHPGWFRRSRTKQFLSPKRFRRSGSAKTAQTESPASEIPSVVVTNSDEEQPQAQSHEETANENGQPPESKTPRTGRVKSMFKRKSMHTQE